MTYNHKRGMLGVNLPSGVQYRRACHGSCGFTYHLSTRVLTHCVAAWGQGFVLGPPQGLGNLWAASPAPEVWKRLLKVESFESPKAPPPLYTLHPPPLTTLPPPPKPPQNLRNLEDGRCQRGVVRLVPAPVSALVGLWPSGEAVPVWGGSSVVTQGPWPRNGAWGKGTAETMNLLAHLLLNRMVCVPSPRTSRSFG